MRSTDASLPLLGLGVAASRRVLTGNASVTPSKPTSTTTFLCASRNILAVGPPDEIREPLKPLKGSPSRFRRKLSTMDSFISLCKSSWAFMNTSWPVEYSARASVPSSLTTATSTGSPKRSGGAEEALDPSAANTTRLLLMCANSRRPASSTPHREVQSCDRSKALRRSFLLELGRGAGRRRPETVENASASHDMTSPLSKPSTRVLHDADIFATTIFLCVSSPGSVASSTASSCQRAPCKLSAHRIAKSANTAITIVAHSRTSTKASSSPSQASSSSKTQSWTATSKTRMTIAPSFAPPEPATARRVGSSPAKRSVRTSSGSATSTTVSSCSVSDRRWRRLSGLMPASFDASAFRLSSGKSAADSLRVVSIAASPRYGGLQVVNAGTGCDARGRGRPFCPRFPATSLRSPNQNEMAGKSS
eukprot:scaffold1051_cov254-Pinguiococcus_pyrenoidosus.AAC.7